MKRPFCVKLLSLFIFPCLVAWCAAGESEDCQSLMKLMPADWPMAIVVTNFQRFDDSMQALGKRLNSEGDGFDMLKDLKGEIGFGDFVDFSKPLGMSAQQFGGSAMPVIWARVPDSANKLKSIPGVTEVEMSIKTETAWLLKKETKETYAKILGDYVVIAATKETLESAIKKDNRSLADEIKGRVDLFSGRDVFLHLNIDPVRDAALAGVAQFGQMAPMFGMMMAQQAGGTDPAVLLGAMTTLAHAAKNVMEQIAYVELALGVDAESVRLTIATGYKDGPIKTYLAQAKSASGSFFSEIEDQPFMIALGYHVPGGESPLIDYFTNQLKKNSASGATPSSSGDSASAKSPLADGLAAMRDLYAKLEGVNMVMSMSGEGIKSSGDYVGSDPSGILESAKKALTAGEAAKALSGGITFEPAGTAKVGEVNVDRYTIKTDAANPASAQAKAFLGEKSGYAIGVCGGRVRYFMGNDKDMETAFSAKTAKPLGSSPGVKAALAKLPENRNGVMLIHPTGVLSFAQTLMGGGTPPAGGTGDAGPAAISFSVGGHPARADVYVPIKAIEQVVKALESSEEPK